MKKYIIKTLSLFLCLSLLLSNAIVSFAEIEEDEILSVKKYSAQQQLKDGFIFNYTVTKSKVYDLIGKNETKFQMVVYYIDVISKATNKKIGNAEVSFDLSYSPKNNTVNISNYQYFLSLANLENNESYKEPEYAITSLAGNKTDTASLSCYIMIDEHSMDFTITADKNSNTFLRIAKQIETDDKSYDEYMKYLGFAKIQEGSYENRNPQKYRDMFKLVKDEDLINSDFNDLVFNVKKYEIEPFNIKAVSQNGEDVPDLKIKNTKIDVEIKNAKDGSQLATLRISAEPKYSYTQKYVSLNTSSSNIQGNNDWQIDTLMCDTSRTSGNGTEVSITTYNILLKDKNKCYNFLLTVKCDKDGNVSISNPVNVY